ncbi:MAG: CdaR family protein [Mariprofundus sp.]|nr:CdaR family protein [Mariprofundus sp.]
MGQPLALFRRYNLQFWALTIAIALWLQVHGQGEGSVSMDVPLQVHGLPANMVIINDFPDHVRLTINGLQSRLKDLRQLNFSVPIDASDLTTPGVVERAPQLSSVSLPVGLHIEKVQPDRLELQVDRLVSRSIPIRASFELPEGWHVTEIQIKPRQVKLTGPEVWLEALREVGTTPIRLTLKDGAFKTRTGIESPSGKAIRLTESNADIVIEGILLQQKRARPVDTAESTGEP